jgi:hypothetical protein
MLAVVEARQGKRGEGSCAWPGCSEPWAQVDHIESRADHPELADDPENWQGLCGYHNSAKGRGDRRPRRSPSGAGVGEASRAWLAS